MEREACVVCDHGFERSDLCAEIIIIIIIIIMSKSSPWPQGGRKHHLDREGKHTNYSSCLLYILRYILILAVSTTIIL